VKSEEMREEGKWGKEGWERNKFCRGYWEEWDGEIATQNQKWMLPPHQFWNLFLFYFLLLCS